MASHGYSGKPVREKIGWDLATRRAWRNVPSEVQAELGIDSSTEHDEGSVDLLIVAFDDRANLASQAHQIAQLIFPAGAVWVLWPKKSSKIQTDVTDDVFRQVLLPLGIVDNKVCAMSANWSGLRFVWRKELRDGSRVPQSTEIGIGSSSGS